MSSMTRRLAASNSGALLCAVLNSSRPIRLHVEDLIFMRRRPFVSAHEIMYVYRRLEQMSMVTR